MHVEEILRSMRAGEPQSAEAISAFVAGVVDQTISRPQAAAWLAWAFARGLDDTETVALTRAMTASGRVLRWPSGSTCIDKHSTGGVGDKVSLPLAPIWAALGLRVPMISGRGLGHTGGTLDKLEAIPGYRTDLSEAEMGRQLDTVGCFITGQTGEVAPADRVLYALRNETSTVESIPLIVASILSKKLAEGVEELVLDVKCGSGAFMADRDRARALAQALVRVATGAGVHCIALLTAMDRPLGVTVGNALEVRESIECLRGEGPKALRDLTIALARHEDAARAIDSGAALDKFRAMIEAQGGDPRVVDDPSRLLGSGTKTRVVEATRDGVVRKIDAYGIGRAAFVLGAGRRRAEDPVDFGVGLEVHAELGSSVVRGQPLVTVHHREGHALDEALALIDGALKIAEPGPAPSALVLETIEAT